MWRAFPLNSFMLHEAGDGQPQRHPIMVRYTNFMTPIALETWCIEVCDGPWWLDADDKIIRLSFHETTDEILFRLSRYSGNIR
jgi:hypothetical protein